MIKKNINNGNLLVLGGKFVLLSAVVLAILVKVEANEPNLPKPPYSIEQLRAWHKSVEPWPWLGQPGQKVHLRNEKDYELLLAIVGYARGGSFILFAELNGIWSQISDEIEQAHHPLYVLDTTNNGWHDFESFVPLWGSGEKEVLVSTYGWNGKRYILKKSETGMWCDYEPFKRDKQRCLTR
jgi:hypothetical protein